MSTQTTPLKSAGRHGRRASILASLVILLIALVGMNAPAANAATVTTRSGTWGNVYAFGGTVCNPFVSSGFARNYIEIGSPLVGETAQITQPGYQTIGGMQLIRWQPWIEKYVAGAWERVWTGTWHERQGYTSTTTFGDPFVDVRALPRHPGPGYFRTGGTIHWLDDSSHHGGYVQYRHSAGNYFKDGYANYGGAYATPVSTGYCYAG